MKEIIAFLSKENAPVFGLTEIIEENRGPLPVEREDRDRLFALYSRARKSLRKYGLIENVYYRVTGDKEEFPIYLRGYMLTKTEPTKESVVSRINRLWWIKKKGLVFKAQDILTIEKALDVPVEPGIGVEPM